MKKLHLFKRTLLLLALIVGCVNYGWAETSTLTFTAACGGSGTADDGTSWTVTSDGNESQYDATKGIHYGTNKADVQYIRLTTSGISGTITQVVVNASTASGVSATASVTVGGSAFGGDAKSLSSNAANYTFNGSASGEIVVTVTKPSKAAKALYVKSITVTYSTAAPTTLSVTYDANGATSGSVPTDNTEYEAGNEVTVLGNTGSLAKAGYNFGGWNTNATGTGTNYNPGETFEISESTTLYAKWNAKTITGLSYTGTPTKTTYNAGESFNPAGLTVTATFDDSSEENVTTSVTWTPDPLTKGTTSVTGTYMGEEIVVNGLTVNAAPGTKENPYTVAEAIAATPLSGTSENKYIHGIVSAFYGTSIVDDGSNYRYYISDDGTTTGQLLVYKGKGLNNVAFSEESDLEIGDEVIVCGGLTTYSGTKEVASGSQLVSLVRKAATPTFSPAAGAVAEGTEVTISTLTDGATIYYTTDGTEPTTSSSHGTAGTASATVTVNATMTIKAIAVKDGLPYSDVATASYTIAIPCATPTFSPAAGTYTAVQSVEISSDTEGAIIYYTTDGTTPTTLSTEYTSAITVDEDMTIKAIAVKDGMAKSAVAEAIYEINLPDYATLPFEYDGNGTGTLPTGLTVSGTGTYTSSPKIKLDTTDDNVILKIGEAPGMLSFDVKGNPSSGSWTGTFKVQTSTDGSSYSDLAVYTDNISTSKETKTLTVPSDARYIKWILTDRKANVALGNIKLSGCQTVTITSVGWATFSSDKALDFTDVTGLEAYMITGHDGVNIVKSQVTGTVPANTGLLLKGDADTYSIPVVASSSTNVSANKMVAGTGASVSAEAGKTKYVLGVNGSTGKAEFQKIVSTSATVPAGKAYLLFNEEIDARVLQFEDEGETTGINAALMNNERMNNEVYNLNGQRVAQPSKGLYIVNGKKVMFK